MNQILENHINFVNFESQVLTCIDGDGQVASSGGHSLLILALAPVRSLIHLLCIVDDQLQGAVGIEGGVIDGQSVSVDQFLVVLVPPDGSPRVRPALALERDAAALVNLLKHVQPLGIGRSYPQKGTVELDWV